MSRTTLRWLPLDLVLVGVFAVLGRMSHHHSLTWGGWWQTAWPFLAGALAGWAVLALARRPGHAVLDGVVVWLATLVGGMLLRQASDQGTATPFVVVATLVLCALLVLPRTVLWAARRTALDRG